MFPDQRAELFGREAAIAFLQARAAVAGLTSVVARPLMGKTWTLQEVARREVETRESLVGYHESKGAEGSHLLYAVANLYTAWLSDSTMREQAVSLWQRHGADLVPRAGQIVGALFEKLGDKLLPIAGLGGLVRSTFEGLAGAQKDLLTGGLELASLSYDDARSITSLVSRITGRRVVLILDAWEKSPSMRADAATLDAFLKHPDDWPHVHIFLGIRSPDVNAGGASDEAFRQAGLFPRLSPAAIRYELAPLDVSPAGEQDRLVAFLHATVPATRGLTSAQLLDRIDGFPGVVGRWTSDVNRDAMRTVDDLDREAATAQTLRYLEFDALLPNLEGPHRLCAARVAFLPRLDEDRWPALRSTVLADVPDAVVDDLIDRHVLDNESWPTYGHDTRHVAARDWFLENQGSFSARAAAALVAGLAAGIAGRADDVTMLGAIHASATFVRGIVKSDVTLTLLDLAASAFGETPVVFEAAFDGRLAAAARQDAAFLPIIALGLVARGGRKVERGDLDGAIADFGRVIDEAKAPVLQRAQALGNRALLASNRDDHVAAIADYDAAIALPEPPPFELARALVNRGVQRKAIGDTEGAIADYDRLIAIAEAPAIAVAIARCNRGTIFVDQGDLESAVVDFETVITGPEFPPAQRAEAFYNRGFVRGLQRAYAAAIEDYSQACAIDGVEPALWTRAMVNRAAMRCEATDWEGAIADATRVIESGDSPPDQVARALSNRVRAGSASTRVGEARSDRDRIIAMSDIPVDVLSLALLQRAADREQNGDVDGAIVDLGAAIALPGIPERRLGDALFCRGTWRARRGPDADADVVRDMDAALALPGMRETLITDALEQRGRCKHRLGDIDGALADYGALIARPDVTPSRMAEALCNRGLANEARGAAGTAEEDYRRVMAMADAPAACRSLAEARVAALVADDDADLSPRV